jgi:CheY-like chemotaxis protein
VLASVSRLLAIDFEIAATVNDGRQAVDAARLLDPDLVVLDISMPGLNGFQAAQELRQTGSRAKLVLLTAHDSDDFVEKAIRCDVNAYVLKMRAGRDLASALHHSLAGRQFLPSVTPLANTERCSHAVQLHATDGSWLDEVSLFVSAGLHRGDVVAVALTQSNLDAVAARLKKRGCDLGEAEKLRRYLPFDAAKASAQIVRDGQAQAGALAEMVEGLERSRLASPRGSQARLTLIGEIAVPLCRGGNYEAAIEIERLWNGLTRNLPFLSVCAYPLECVDLESPLTPFPAICAEHSVISYGRMT